MEDHAIFSSRETVLDQARREMRLSPFGKYDPIPLTVDFISNDKHMNTLKSFKII